MGDDDSVGKGCLFGFGVGFGLLLAGMAVVGVVGSVLVVGCVVLMGASADRLQQTRDRLEAEQSEVSSPPESEVAETPVSEDPPEESQKGPRRIATQAGVEGYLTARKGYEVEILIEDGTTTLVPIFWLTEESQQVVRDAFPDPDE